MAGIEAFEMDAHRAQLTSDLTQLVERYRAIFGWNVPEIDEGLAHRLILQSLRGALDDLERQVTTAPA